MSERAALRPGDRVLVTRLRFLGDVILSLPLVAELRRALPECEIHYMAEPPGCEMLEAQPEIDRLWPADRGAWATAELARRLRAARVHAVIDLFANPRSALLVRATGAAIRIGEDRRGRRYAYTEARRLVAGRSAIEQHLDALRPLGLTVPRPARPVLQLRDVERDAGAARWRSLGLRSGVLVHVGATQRAKEWPAEHVVEFCRSLDRDGIPVLLSSAPHRVGETEELAARARPARLLPPLALRDWLGVAQHAAGVVTVDGMPAHAAVALGRPTVALFGPTDPSIWFPYSSFGPYRVLHAGVDCRSCDRVECAERRCMRALAPHAVRETLLELIGARAGAA